jgi:mono/diheme cytochrome c family protein
MPSAVRSVTAGAARAAKALAGIYTTIAVGVTNRSMGGTMGAFGTTMTGEEITAVITFLRVEEKRRIEAGEVPDPYKDQ